MTLGNGYSLVHNDVNILENILEKKRGQWPMRNRTVLMPHCRRAPDCCDKGRTKKRKKNTTVVWRVGKIPIGIPKEEWRSKVV